MRDQEDRPVVPPSIARQVDDELAEHVRRRTDDLVRTGLPPTEAARQAIAEFGDLDAARRDLIAIDLRVDRRQGRASWWDGIGRDVWRAGRRLVRQPLSTSIMMLTFALAIGAGTAVFSVVDQTVLRPPPFRDGNRLVDVLQTDRQKTGGGNAFTPLEIVVWREQRSVFERFEAYAPRVFDLAGDGEPERVEGRVVSLGLFDMLGVAPVIGRGFEHGDGAPGSEPVVILGEGFWRRRFGSNPAALGARLRLNDESYTIVGVLPERVHLLNADEDVWVPVDLTATGQSVPGLFGLGRLAPGLDTARAQDLVERIAEGLQRARPLARGWYLMLRQKRAAWVDPASQQALFLLLGAVGALVLVACANVAGLLLGQWARRARETSLRSALGASRARLAREALAEGLLLATGGGALGWLLAGWLVGLVTSIIPADLAFWATAPITLDRRILTVTAAVTAACGVSCALWPALSASRRASADALRDGLRATTPSSSAGPGRAILVAGEVACSVALLVGALLMARTMVTVYALDPGFEPDGLISMRLNLPSDRYATPASKHAFLADVQARLRSVPGVFASAMTTGVPPELGGFGKGRLEAERGAPSDGQLMIPWGRVSASYFAAAGIPLVAGRTFTAQEHDDVVIVSRALADRLWPGGGALGSHVRFTFTDGLAEWRRVVGIVGEVEAHAARDERTPLQMYYPWAPRAADSAPTAPRPSSARRSYSYQILIVRALRPEEVIPAIKAAIWTVDPRQPVEDVALASDLYREAFGRQRFVFLLMTICAATALLFTSAGLFGLLSQGIVERRREIGVRVALGASPADIVKLVAGRALALCVGGLVAGLAAAMLLTRSLTSVLIGVGPFDAASFGWTAALLLLVAALACVVPTRAALALDPATTLRAD